MSTFVLGQVSHYNVFILKVLHTVYFYHFLSPAPTPIKSNQIKCTNQIIVLSFFSKGKHIKTSKQTQ